MTNRLTFSTIAGYVTINETFAQLLDQLRLARDCIQRMATPLYKSEDYLALSTHIILAEEAANTVGHLLNTEDDDQSKLLSRGWYGVAEMLHNNRETLRILAANRHINRWDQVGAVYDKIIHEVQLMHKRKLQ